MAGHYPVANIVRSDLTPFSIASVADAFSATVVEARPTTIKEAFG